MINIDLVWYRKSLHPVSFCLLPFSWLFGTCAAMRRMFYRAGIFKTYRFNVPVIVVGNIAVGGTGKTPFVIWLAAFLQAQGYKPGIVSRGVGGKSQDIPYRVQAEDNAWMVGDEAMLLLRNSQCPLVIGIDRAAAVRELLKQTDCDIVISDDGLQHYGLWRDLEIVMVDAERQFGNRQLLPAGPLRERPSRLAAADFVVTQVAAEAQQDGLPPQGEAVRNEFHAMQLLPQHFIAVANPDRQIPFADFSRQKVHALAGIGHPQRFFDMLKKAGFELITHVFPDHHLYQPGDLCFADSLPIIMTEKDAVKCAGFADERYWHVKVNACVNESFGQQLMEKLK